ncbi:DUF3857 domain-containing protein [Namhaeicola litoreus]|uniref:DUF3857 domain-containing protein n=1 Tax=Namhaeicola litoreus TaxID=1052145 RepID=A0ABW3Y0T5_9FLAO
MRNSFLFIAFTLIISFNLIAQDIKFGKISKEELEEKFYPQDTSANAVVLYKNRESYFTYNDNMGWILHTKVHERIKIYNKNGFDSATKKVRLYFDNGENESISIKAFTYNLENGKVEKTKLEKDGIFSEEISEKWESRNFTLPNLKDGSVVEWEYTIDSPFYTHIDDVICQYKIPIKKLEVRVKVPEFLEFKVTPSAYYPISFQVGSDSQTVNYSEKTRTSYGYGGGVTSSKVNYGSAQIQEKTYTVNQENIPALVEEPYISSLDNYRALLDFEILAYRPTNGVPKFYNSSWEDVVKTIYDSDRFGGQLKRSNYFKDDLEKIQAATNNQNELIIGVFEFLKQKFSWNENFGYYTSVGGIRSAYQEGTGNVADINLTLVAMLQEANISAHPVLLSTRSHGIPMNPTHEGFNYVIAGVEIAGNYILMDATDKHAVPNLLPVRDLNWFGRVVKEDGSSVQIPLYPSEHSEKNIKLSCNINTDGSIDGTMIANLSSVNAMIFREKYETLTEEEQKTKIESEFTNFEIEQLRINNLDNNYKNIQELVKFSAVNQVDLINDKIYFSPLLFLTESESPFKLDERNFPVDFATPWIEDYRISIKIPQGYTVESVPEEMAIGLSSNLGSFIIKTEINQNKIEVIYQAKINKAVIPSIVYPELKKQYDMAIAKQQEKIVISPAIP